MKQKFYFLVFVFIYNALTAHAQIYTRTITPAELPKLVKDYQNIQSQFVSLPLVDVESLKKEDERLKDKVDYVRYGKARYPEVFLLLARFLNVFSYK